MSAEVFLDTNVLVYVFAAEDVRSERAERLLEQGGAVSVQVLNEFVNVMRRKLQRDWAEIAEAVHCLRVLLSEPLPLTIETHDTAFRLARDRGFAFYDSLIVAAALQAKSPILYTEDLQDGLTIEGLTIRNPFATRSRAS